MYRRHNGDVKFNKKEQAKLEQAVKEQEAKNAATKPKLSKSTGLPDRRRFNGKNLKTGTKPPTPAKIAAKLSKGREIQGHDLITISAGKLNDELKQKFIQYILQGATQETAAYLCDVMPVTVRSWYAKAMDPTEPDPKYSGFMMAVKKAEAIYAHQVELYAISPTGKFNPQSGPQFQSPRDAMDYMRLIGHPRVAKQGGVTVDKETGELKAPTGAVGTPSLTEVADMTLEEMELIKEMALRSIEGAKARGGVKGNPEGIKEPKLGYKIVPQGEEDF